MPSSFAIPFPFSSFLAKFFGSAARGLGYAAAARGLGLSSALISGPALFCAEIRGFERALAVLRGLSCAATPAVPRGLGWAAAPAVLRGVGCAAAYSGASLLLRLLLFIYNFFLSVFTFALEVGGIRPIAICAEFAHGLKFFDGAPTFPLPTDFGGCGIPDLGLLDLGLELPNALALLLPLVGLCGKSRHTPLPPPMLLYSPAPPAEREPPQAPTPLRPLAANSAKISYSSHILAYASQVVSLSATACGCPCVAGVTIKAGIPCH